MQQLILSLTSLALLALLAGCQKHEINQETTTETNTETPETPESPSISLSSELLNLECTESTQTITVTSNVGWMVLLSEDTANWITVSPSSAIEGETKVEIHIAENTGLERSATIQFRSFGASGQLTINQDEADVTYQDFFNGEEEEIFTIDGTVAAVSYKGFIITKNDVSVHVYYSGIDAKDVNVGDWVSVTGHKFYYEGLPRLQVMNFGNTKVTPGAGTFAYPEPIELTIDAFESYEKTSCDYVRVEIPSAGFAQVSGLTIREIAGSVYTEDANCSIIIIMRDWIDTEHYYKKDIAIYGYLCYCESVRDYALMLTSVEVVQ